MSDEAIFNARLALPHNAFGYNVGLVQLELRLRGVLELLL